MFIVKHETLYDTEREFVMTNTKIYRLSRVLRVVTVLGMIAVAGLELLLMVGMPFGIYLTPPDERGVLDTPSFFVTFFLWGVYGLLFLHVLNQLRKLFGTYMAGDVVSDKSATLIQKAGFGLLLCGLVDLMTPFIAAAVTWATNGPAEYAELEAFGISQLGFIFAAGILIVIGWAMSDAAHIAEEHKAIV
jgi:hypothetical protein